MKELLSQFLIYGGLFFLLFIVIYIINRQTDWRKIQEERIIQSIKNGTAITTHPIF